MSFSSLRGIRRVTFIPQIAVANALRARGHEVAFYCGAAERKGVGIRKDIACFRSPKWTRRIWTRCSSAPERHSSSPSGGFSFATLLREWMIESIPDQVADLEAILQEWKPDAIASEVSMWGPTFILGELGRVPVAITSFMPCCMIPGPDAPPFGLGLPKPRNFRTRLVARARGRSGKNS